MTRTRGLLTAAAVPLIMMAGCARSGEAGSAPAAEPIAESAPANPVVLVRIAQQGGFVPANFAYGRLPEITVYSDGRVISNGPVPLSYPGPALPNLLVSRITPARAQQWADDAVKAGVKSGADLGTPGVTDIPDTVLTATSQGKTETVRVNALRQARPDDPYLTAEQRAARKKLAAYADELTGFADSVSSPAPDVYRPLGVVALVEAYVAGDVEQPEKAWPGPALPGEELNAGTGLHCVAVTGAEKDTILAAAGAANQLTPWTSGGKQWKVTFRPLLPDETGGCAALKGAR
ncbi:hypothetical protein [Actinoplanes sp. NPDC020271]|uniref:hypothetical protein n=1 Tax=Actinoplanes sp. NPDC020271 TaxID=3363896 RepID=UPI0037A438D3